MAEFSFSAKDTGGQTVSSSLQATDRKDAIRKIRARGLTPIQVSSGNASSSKPQSIQQKSKASKVIEDKPLKAVKISRRHGLPFLKNFYELHKSGLPIAEALRILNKRIKDPAQATITKKLLRNVQEGKSFSDSLSDMGNVFDGSTINLIGAGEMTGNLHEVLARLIEYMENRRELRNKVIGSLIYPCILLFAAVGVVIFFLFVLMPRMQALFDSLGGQLPIATRWLLGLADFFLYAGPFIAVGGFLIITSLWRWHKTEKGGLVIDRFLLRIPLLGNMIIYAETTQITQTLGLLLENGVTTVEAFKLTGRTIGNNYISQEFKVVRQKVSEGTAVTKALENMDIMPEIMLDLISVGENTGNLVPSFYEVTKMFQKRLEQILNTLTGVISLGALLFAFMFVALIAFGIVSAIFGVSQSLSH
ncbi:MAG: type II secretion system F family protein [Verrucomicrobia bacterium]|nr:type II secretion system F family protein [Verrucomicrobiota bacterium]MDA1065374.1 type II secretion system F family protein [Verrucomicrobiota bacterium]